MVCFDASVLIDLFNDRLAGPRKERMEVLMAKLGKEKVVIPTPAYAEFLTRAATAREAYHTRIESSSTFRVEPFSKRASIECAIMLDQVFSAKEKRMVSKAKIKFDWMIVATAKAVGASCVYTSDQDISRCCKHAALACILIGEIQIPPPEPKTTEMFPDGSG